MSRRFAFLLSLALVMAVALTGCGMNKEKAIEQMGQALTDSSVIESGRLTGEISGPKARLRLMLVLGLTRDMDRIRSFFEPYAR